MPNDEALKVVELVSRRERHGLRIWAILTGALWTITAAYLAVLILGYLVFVHPVVDELLIGGEPPATSHRAHADAFITGLKALLYWPLTLIAAAGCTMAFTIVSRRTTLRLIHESLADISDQLRQLAQAP